MITKSTVYLTCFCTAILLIPFHKAFSGYNIPDSRFGPGIVETNQLAPHAARGNLSITSLNNQSFAPANPATYGALEWTSFKTGGRGTFSEIKHGDQTLQGENTSLSYMMLGFPVNTDLNWGMAFGFAPYSHASYNLTIPTLENDQVRRLNGEGSLNRFFLGSSIGLFDGLKFGINAGYLYGQYSGNNALMFTDGTGAEHSRTSWQADLGGFILNGGLHYRYKREGSNYYHIAATTEWAGQIDGDMHAFAHTFSDDGNGFEIRDTISLENDVAHSLEIPPRYSFGIETGRDNRWSAGIQVDYQQWSDFSGLRYPANLHDESGIYAGASYTPEYDDVERYFRTVTYNIGMNYVSTYREDRGNQLEKYSISGGLDLPVPRGESKIHLALQAGTYRHGGDLTFEHNFIKFFAAFSLTERWFQERRIN